MTMVMPPPTMVSAPTDLLDRGIRVTWGSDLYRHTLRAGPCRETEAETDKYRKSDKKFLHSSTSFMLALR